MRPLVDRRNALGARRDANGVVIAQVFAHPRQIIDDADTELLQQRPRSDARKLQQLRGVDRARADYDFAPGVNLAHVLALPVTYSDRTRCLEQYRLGLSMGAQVHGASADRRMKECVGATYPPASVDVALEVACAFLTCTVIVRIARDAHLGRTLDECFA